MKPGITERECEVWKLAPWMSEKNKAYGLGDRDNKWGDLLNVCNIDTSFYNMILDNDINPLFELMNNITEKKIRKLIADLIITLGLILQNRNELTRARYETMLDIHFILYSNIYDIAITKLGPEYVEKSYVKPENLLDLGDANFIGRPKNPYIISSKSGEQHPLGAVYCPGEILEVCKEKYASVNNWSFQPLVKYIQCYCSFFKKKLKLTNLNTTTLESEEYMDVISNNDYDRIKSFYGKYTLRREDLIKEHPPILIKQYPEGGVSCEDKNYLSQLFAKVCPPLYSRTKVVTGNPVVDKYIAGLKDRYYDNNDFTVFHSFIDHSTIPVYFVSGNDVYIDNYKGPSFQFFNEVISELVIHKVFIESDTQFSNRRYELNFKFDVGSLECYKNAEAEGNTLDKEAITRFFYRFVGYLLHFAVSNNIELPFSLSRVYIGQLFGIYDLLSDTIYKDINLQVLLVSIYLMEKAPPILVKQFMRIFENPELLQTDDPEIQAVFNSDGEVRMNDLYVIVPEEENRVVYDKNPKKLFKNVLELLYKLAIKSYLQDLDSEVPVTPDRPINIYFQEFFRGFIFCKEYDKNTAFRLQAPPLNYFKDLSNTLKMTYVRKLDVYLSGFGITPSTIKKFLLPRIVSTDPNSPVPDMLHEILTSDGKRLSREFVRAYNYKFFGMPVPSDENAPVEMRMSREEYHIEFVKYLLKTWSGYTNINVNNKYTIDFIKRPDGTFRDRLPQTHTCFSTLDINKEYGSTQDLYNDLVKLVINTGFGETLNGGKKMKKYISKSKKDEAQNRTSRGGRNRGSSGKKGKV